MDPSEAPLAYPCKVLVTGGCGYIGSHAVWRLLADGAKAVVIDTLENGKQSAIDSALAPALIGRELASGDLAFYQGDIGDRAILDRIFAEHPDIRAVLNFAAYVEVGESVKQPLKYYQNNLSTAVNLIDALVRHNVRFMIQSSTAAVYGEIDSDEAITEATPTLPINSYGASKLMVEKVMADAAQAHGLRFVVFRYFNVVGNHPTGLVGEDRAHETHLVPIVIRAAKGKMPRFSIFGDDYATKDGTCVRDYVDMHDLISAHVKGLQYLIAGGQNQTLNLGSNKGFTVKEIVDLVKQTTGTDFPVVVVERRPGDPKSLIASNKLAGEVLGWAPTVPIQTSIENVWRYVLHKDSQQPQH
jgi:UDP-glucose 4-epimerase